MSLVEPAFTPLPTEESVGIETPAAESAGNDAPSGVDSTTSSWVNVENVRPSTASPSPQFLPDGRPAPPTGRPPFLVQEDENRNRAMELAIHNREEYAPTTAVPAVVPSQLLDSEVQHFDDEGNQI